MTWRPWSRLILLTPVLWALGTGAPETQGGEPAQDGPNMVAQFRRDQFRRDFPNFPGRRSQTQLILEDNHKKSLEDLDEILRLLEEMRDEIEAPQPGDAPRTDLERAAQDIEKLAKRVRSRLRWY